MTMLPASLGTIAELSSSSYTVLKHVILSAATKFEKLHGANTFRWTCLA